MRQRGEIVPGGMFDSEQRSRSEEAGREDGGWDAGEACHVVWRVGHLEGAIVLKNIGSLSLSSKQPITDFLITFSRMCTHGE